MSDGAEMGGGVEIFLKIIMAILNTPHRLLLVTIPGRGFKCDRIDGQVVCPKCLKTGTVVPMLYDRHLEIPHKDGIPGCATDRFVCRTCFHEVPANGRVGKLLNRHSPFGIFTFANVFRFVCVKTRRWLRTHKHSKEKTIYGQQTAM